MLRSGLVSACVVRFRSMGWINENVPLHLGVVDVTPRHPLPLRDRGKRGTIPRHSYYHCLKTFTRTLYDHTCELQ